VRGNREEVRHLDDEHLRQPPRQRRTIDMTDKEKGEEGAGEDIEDLEAPAEAQEDVAGGRLAPTVYCKRPTCIGTCTNKTAGGPCGPNSVIVVQIE
jgi:hypothetical protein